MVARWPLAVTLFLVEAMAACGSSMTASHAASPSPARTATPVAQVHAESLNVAGVERSYELFVPSTLDPTMPPPLVVILHPCPNTTAAQVAVALDSWATTGRFIAAYPQGAVESATGGTCWNAGACCTGADDVGFISRLIDQLTAQLQVDETRVYVAGFSFGAAMAYRVGCELSDKVVAIAPVSGALVFQQCDPDRPVSLLIMQGTADTTFPYQGGGDDSVPSVASVAKLWPGLDGCRGTGAESQAGIVAITDWMSCAAGTEVELQVIAGAPYTWFGLEPGALPGEPNASSVVWNFFNRLPTRT